MLQDLGSRDSQFLSAVRRGATNRAEFFAHFFPAFLTSYTVQNILVNGEFFCLSQKESLSDCRCICLVIYCRWICKRNLDNFWIFTLRGRRANCIKETSRRRITVTSSLNEISTRQLGVGGGSFVENFFSLIGSVSHVFHLFTIKFRFYFFAYFRLHFFALLRFSTFCFKIFAWHNRKPQNFASIQ